MIDQATETRLMFFMKERGIYKFTTDEAINYLLDMIEDLEVLVSGLEDELNAKTPFDLY